MSNNNATVALPGHRNWDVWWSPESGFDNFQLDIVGFLAVLGESSVTANAQVAALSRLFYLPRLLPAPQALLRTSRPTTLIPREAKVTGVHSGNVKDHVHHVANVLLGEPMEKYTVQHVTIQKKVRNPDHVQTSISDILFRGISRKARTSTDQTVLPSPVKAKATGPLFWVTMIGFLEVVILFACSIIFGDGMSLLATILLGGLSTVVGVCNKWTLELSKLPDKAAATGAGDAVIRYPNGSYKIVKCTEEVARELFFAPEEIDYNIKSETVYRLLSLIGTVMLMLGVIALANAKLQLQFGWAGAFIIINIAHWVAAALPQSSHWDLSCYNYDIVTYPEEEEQCPPAEEGQKSPISKLTRTLQKMLQDKPDQKPKSNFTIALWKAILLTKSIAWVPLKEAAPSTVVWDEWLVEAEIKAKQLWKELQQEEDNEKKKSPSPLFQRPNPDDWDAKDAWNELYKKHNPKPLSTAPTPAPTIQGV